MENTSTTFTSDASGEFDHLNSVMGNVQYMMIGLVLTTAAGVITSVWKICQRSSCNLGWGLFQFDVSNRKTSLPDVTNPESANLGTKKKSDEAKTANLDHSIQIV